MAPIALLFVIGVAHLGPELFSEAFGGVVVAWETVCYGIEAACLWGFVACGVKVTPAVLAVAALGFFESIQRPLCRSAFDMAKPLKIKAGEYACDIATGFPVSYLSPVLVAVVVFIVVAEITTGRTCKT